MLWEAEFGDLIVDIVGILVAVGVLVCLWCRGEKFKDITWYNPFQYKYVLAASGILCFVADVVLEVIVKNRVEQAMESIVEMKSSFCFSLGDGYASFVKLEDMADTISNLAIANIVFAAIGMLAEIVQTCSEGPVENTAVAFSIGSAVLELVLGFVSFWFQTNPFVHELETIELAAVGLKELEDGHVCFQRHPGLAPTTATGMTWSPDAFLTVVLPALCIVLVAILYSCVVFCFQKFAG